MNAAFPSYGDTLSLIPLYGGTFLLSLALTGVSIWFARRRHWLAHPVDRSSHTVPTPQVGGIGICVSLLVAILFLGKGIYYVPVEFGPAWIPLASLAACIVAWAFLIGLVDDLVSLRAQTKLVGLIILAAIPPFFGVTIGFTGPPSPGLNISFLFGALLVPAWILFFANAFNFMDGVNGQSGVFALNALLWFAFMGENTLCSLHGETRLIGLTAAAVLGFLVWNFPRALTFMGDSGSLPLGALLALLAVVLGKGDLVFSISFLFPLSLYIYDVIYTLIRRAARRENLFAAHRSHLYQRLLIASGWSHVRLLAFHLPFYLLTGFCGCIWGSGEPLLALVPTVFLLALYTFIVLRFEKRKNAADVPAAQ